MNTWDVYTDGQRYLLVSFMGNPVVKRNGKIRYFRSPEKAVAYQDKMLRRLLKIARRTR